MLLIFVLQLFLCKLLQEDEKKGLKEIFREFQADIINFLRIKLSGNRELAEELFQEAALAFIKYVANNKIYFSSDNKIKNYLITIAMNKLKDHLKREKLSFKHFRFFNSRDEFNDFLGNISDASKGPEESAVDQNEGKKIKAIVDSAMLRLPEQHRKILMLKFFENKSNQEIAEILKISIKAAESLLYRSKEAFKANFKTAALKEQYYDFGLEDKNG
jgi:RNA polymerase sigma factor (sigma-70 family)